MISNLSSRALLWFLAVALTLPQLAFGVDRQRVEKEIAALEKFFQSGKEIDQFDNGIDSLLVLVDAASIEGYKCPPNVLKNAFKVLPGNHWPEPSSTDLFRMDDLRRLGVAMVELSLRFSDEEIVRLFGSNDDRYTPFRFHRNLARGDDNIYDRLSSVGLPEELIRFGTRRMRALPTGSARDVERIRIAEGLCTSLISDYDCIGVSGGLMRPYPDLLNFEDKRSVADEFSILELVASRAEEEFSELGLKELARGDDSPISSPELSLAQHLFDEGATCLLHTALLYNLGNLDSLEEWLLRELDEIRGNQNFSSKETKIFALERAGMTSHFFARLRKVLIDGGDFEEELQWSRLSTKRRMDINAGEMEDYDNGSSYRQFATRNSLVQLFCGYRAASYFLERENEDDVCRQLLRQTTGLGPDQFVNLCDGFLRQLGEELPDYGNGRSMFMRTLSHFGLEAINFFDTETDHLKQVGLLPEEAREGYIKGVRVAAAMSKSHETEAEMDVDPRVLLNLFGENVDRPSYETPPKIGVYYHMDLPKVLYASEFSDRFSDREKSQMKTDLLRLFKADLLYRLYDKGGSAPLEDVVGALINLEYPDVAAQLSIQCKNLVPKYQAKIRNYAAAQNRSGRISLSDEEDRSLLSREAEIFLFEGDMGGFETWPDFSVAPSLAAESGEIIIDFFEASQFEVGRGIVQTLFGAIYDEEGFVKIVSLARVEEVKASALVLQNSLLMGNKPVFEEARGRLVELFGPILSVIQDSRHTTICPVGVVNIVPLAVLLSEEVGGSLSYRSSLRPDGNSGNNRIGSLDDGALLVGNPFFSSGEPLAEVAKLDDRGEKRLRGSHVDFQGAVSVLPGTALEIDQIGTLLSGYEIPFTMLSEEKATEVEVLQQFSGKSLIHLATHGFQLSNEDDSYGPLLGSVLALSGSETTMKLWQRGIFPSGGSDGFLDGFSIASAEMSKCELVVLSACDTSKGEADGLEAIQGMPLALSAAGAKRVIMTMWPVDDNFTIQFMDRLYQEFLSEHSSNDGEIDFEKAFQRVKAEMKSKFDNEMTGLLHVEPYNLISLE